MNPTVQELNTKREEAVNAGQNPYSGSLSNYTTFASNPVITSESLNNVTPFNLKQPSPLTGAAGLQGAIEGATTAFTASRAEEQRLAQEQAGLKAKETAVTASKQSFMDKLLGRESKTAMADTAYTATVDPAKKELDDINNQILSEQLSNRRRIESLDKTFTGTVEGKNTEIARINRESVSKQADLAVIQYARQNNYATAKEIADRKIAVQLEQDAQDIELLKFAYEENKKLFDKDETRQYEEMITKKDREYEEKKTNLKTISDTKIKLLQSASEQKAPASILSAIQSAETAEEAIVAAGQYGGDILEREIQRAQYSNILSQISDRQNETGEMTAAQSVASGFAQRMIESGRVIDQIGDQFTSAGSYVGRLLPNIMKGSDRQKFEQAQRNFINAVLRRESGAVISEEEFANARLQYFPQPGDNPAVLMQKKQNRDTSTNSLLVQSGFTPISSQAAVDPLKLGTTNNPLGI